MASTTTTPLPIEEVRSKFPALQQPQVFLDNAGGSQTLGSVITAIHDYLSKTNVQLGASYTSSKLSTDLYGKGYAAAAGYISAPRGSIVLGSSTTQLYRNVSYALTFASGSEVVLSKLDHEANIASWVALAARCNLTIKWWRPEDSDSFRSPGSINPKLTPENLLPLLSDKTVFVACTHASNILGTIHDIKAIAKTIRSRCPKALFCVDAVAYAPHRPIDVLDLDVDFYAFSWYKVYGPHIAQLYASPRALEHVQPLGHYFNPSSTLEDKLGLAGSSYELVAAVPAVVDYLANIPGASKQESFWSQVKAHEEGLQKLLLTYLATNDRVTILGEPDPNSDMRVSTISFVVNGKGSQEIVEAVDAAAGSKSAVLLDGKDGDMGLGESRQFGIRWGHFYSKRLCEEVLGLKKDGEGVVRVSMVHYNSEQEVRDLIEALKRVLE